MTNFDSMKQEIINTIPEVKKALRLKREANRQLQAINKILEGSLAYDKYHLQDFSTGKILENAHGTISTITHKYGLHKLSDIARNTSYLHCYDKAINKYINKIKYIKNYTLNDVLDDVVDYVSDKSGYTVNNNKIKYNNWRYSSGMSSYNIFQAMLNFIQLYEISVNSDILNNEIPEKLGKAISDNKLDLIQYKNLKIKVYQNGNYEITFADKKELAKVQKTINETIKRRNQKKGA